MQIHLDECKDNYSVTSNNIKFVHKPLGGLLHLVQRGVPNVTAHPSTASVPINVLPYNGPLLFGFNVLIKGLKKWSHFWIRCLKPGDRP